MAPTLFNFTLNALSGQTTDGAWTKTSLPQGVNSLKSISSGALGVWGLGDGGQVLHYKDDRWELSSTQSLEQISVGKDALWGVTSGYEVWKGEQSSGIIQWSRVHGVLKQISASESGQVWGTNANGRIWRLKGDQWEQIPGLSFRVNMIQVDCF